MIFIGEGLQVLGRSFGLGAAFLGGAIMGEKAPFCGLKGASAGTKGAISAQKGVVMGEKGSFSYQKGAFAVWKAHIQRLRCKNRARAEILGEWL